MRAHMSTFTYESTHTHTYTRLYSVRRCLGRTENLKNVVKRQVTSEMVNVDSFVARGTYSRFAFTPRSL